jgi:hypothetical protein
VEEFTEVGIPVIEQFAVFKESPEGRVGLTAQLTIAPPEFEGVSVAIATLFVKVKGELA